MSGARRTRTRRRTSPREARTRTSERSRWRRVIPPRWIGRLGGGEVASSRGLTDLCARGPVALRLYLNGNKRHRSAIRSSSPLFVLFFCSSPGAKRPKADGEIRREESAARDTERARWRRCMERRRRVLADCGIIGSCGSRYERRYDRGEPPPPPPSSSQWQ